MAADVRAGAPVPSSSETDRSSIPAAVSLSFIIASLENEVLGCVVHADEHDDDHEPAEELVHVALVDVLVDGAPADAAQDAAADHARDEQRVDDREIDGRNARDGTRRLRAQDDEERILRRLLGAHAEKEVEHDEVDGPSTDAKEGRHDTEREPDDHTRRSTRDVERGDTALVEVIDERPDRDDAEGDRLNGTCELGRGKQPLHDIEELLAREATHRCSNRQGHRRLALDGSCARKAVAQHRIAGHGQDRAAREEVDGTGQERTRGIEHGLDDHAAADAADSPDDRGAEADDEEQRVHETSRADG